MVDQQKCILCEDRIIENQEFPSLYRVTSDCRPWQKGGRLAQCPQCGLAQKIIDNKFREDCRKIYQKYAVYHQGEGSEQRVFEANGLSLSRSQAIIKEMAKHHLIPESGDLLDIGCGNGNMLKTFAEYNNNWRLYGAELDDRHRSDIMKISGVHDFFYCPIEEIPGYYQIISLLHTLEHMTDPVSVLRSLHDKLDDKGQLLIQVPDFSANPFDLVIADHCSHFTRETLAELLTKAGWKVVFSEQCVAKEITVSAVKSPKTIHLVTGETSAEITPGVDWLQCVSRQIKNMAENGQPAVFGTSIAGNWVFAELQGEVLCFIDEDPERAGRKLLDKPIYNPQGLPEQAEVFLALPRNIAERIRQRMVNKEQYHLPPLMPLITREQILEHLQSVLEPLDFVHAMWQGGAAAWNRVDMWSDIDLQVDADDDSIERVFEIVEQSLNQLSTIEIYYRIPSPTWHGHEQAFYRLRDANRYLCLDFVVMKHSSDNRFNEKEQHGSPVVSFDKNGIVTEIALDREKLQKQLTERLPQLRAQFDLFQPFVLKEIRRGHFLEAISFYHNMTLRPLVELLRIYFCPERHRFHLRYIDKDLPQDMLEIIESLYVVNSLLQLEDKRNKAEQLFREVYRKKLPSE